MHQRSDIFTVKNILTILVVGFLIIGLYSYHGLNYKLNASNTSLRALQMQMDADESQLKSCLKAKVSCLKDAMQLRATTIEIRSKYRDAEIELRKDKHEISTKLAQCQKESQQWKTQMEKLHQEVLTLKEEDRNKVQKKRDEEEEKEKKLKEMTAEHELALSRLKDQVSDLQREKATLKTRLETALASRSSGDSLKEKKKEVPKKSEDDETPRQMQPPDLKKSRKRKMFALPSLTKSNNTIIVGATPLSSVNITETTKRNSTRTPAPNPPPSSGLRMPFRLMRHVANITTTVYNKEKLLSKHRILGDDTSELKAQKKDTAGEDASKDKEAAKEPSQVDSMGKADGKLLAKHLDDSRRAERLPSKDESNEQQLAMPLPREASKQNKDANQLPHPGGQAGLDNLPRAVGNRAANKAILPVNDDDARRM